MSELSERIREEQQIARLEAYYRLSEADDKLIRDVRPLITRAARRRDYYHILGFLLVVLSGVITLCSIFTIYYWLSGGGLR